MYMYMYMYIYYEPTSFICSANHGRENVKQKSLFTATFDFLYLELIGANPEASALILIRLLIMRTGISIPFPLALPSA